MKPNFALSLSFDGLRLMHRVDGGWHSVGQVALDDPDLTGALARLKTAAEGLDTAPLSTKLLIPNEQIKFLALDTTRAEDADVRAALDGATPYAVDDLVYDFAKGGGRTYVAAVARETLDEAEGFASEHGFNPVSFAAVPEPFTFVGEASFGAVAGQTVERDTEAVVVIGAAAVTWPVDGAAAQQMADTPPEQDPAPEPAAEPQPLTEPEAFATPEPLTEPEPSIAPEPNPEPEPAADAAPEAEPTPEPAPTPAPDVDTNAAPVDTPDVPVAENSPSGDSPPEKAVTEDIARSEEDLEQSDDPLDEDEAQPEFVPRLRADRGDAAQGAPAPTVTPVQQVASPSVPSDDRIDGRSEPTFSRRTAPLVAAPESTGSQLSAENDGPVVAAPSVPAPSDDAPSESAAPAITGDTATAAYPEVAAASLQIDTDPNDTPAEGRGVGATALGAASAVGGAVGGMFASRRMARAERRDAAADDTAAATQNRKSGLSVFGARQKPAPKKRVVGGKPRFLGLILTAILLLFLLAVAAFAALSSDTVARWLGFGSDDTQIAETATTPDTDDATLAAVTTSSAAPDTAPDTGTPSGADLATAAPQPDAPEADPMPVIASTGRILTPEEAQRIYAATGVWQRAPRIPQVPRTSTLDALDVAVTSRPVPRVPASPLIDANRVTGDAVIAAPIDPPPPSATFNFDPNGRVVATPEGALTPDGILVFAGAPPLNPPTRPGTVAPVVTPQDQLASVVPDTATPLPDAPDGVIVISGTPAIIPPVRPGTAAPATPPAAEAIAAGQSPLVANDDIVVLAGTPPVLPPIRPGTVAPTIAPTASPALSVPDLPEAVDPATQPLAEQTPDNAPLAAPEGLNVIAGPPPVLPPARLGTVAPQRDASVEALSGDVATALATSTAQTPETDTPRPLLRPAAIVQAAAARANTPVLGNLTVAEATAFRPRTRPAGLAPVPEPVPAPVPEETAAEPQNAGLQIAPELAAAVQAAANRPSTIINPTQQAVASSARPDTRPRNMARIVERAEAAQARATQQVAAAAPRTVQPSGPTGSAVAQNATLSNAINLRDINLIGIYGGSGDRRALVRLANGRFERVTVGDRLDGGRVTAISESRLSYTLRGRSITLEVPG